MTITLNDSHLRWFEAYLWRSTPRGLPSSTAKLGYGTRKGPRVTKLTKIEKTIKEPQVTKTSNGVEIKFDLPEKPYAPEVRRTHNGVFVRLDPNQPSNGAIINYAPLPSSWDPETNCFLTPE